MFQTRQAGAGRQARQVRHPDARLGQDAVVADGELRHARAQFEHDAAHSRVAEKQIGPLADDQQGQVVFTGEAHHPRHLRRRGGFDEQVGGAADAPAAMRGERRAHLEGADFKADKLLNVGGEVAGGHG